MIALIDYKAGNLTSVRKALTSLGAEILTPERPSDLDGADAIIVPGVGHFEATAALDASWHDAIRARLADGVPLLGICLGQQFLFEGSEEAPGKSPTRPGAPPADRPSWLGGRGTSTRGARSGGAGT